MKAIAIRTKNLQISYDQQSAVSGVNIAIPTRKITALIGASGSGKSTFLRSLNRILELAPEAKISGRVEIDGHDIYHPRTNILALRQKVGLVFQTPTPFPQSIYDNVAYGPRLRGINRAQPIWQFWRQKYDAHSIAHSDNPLDRLVYTSLQQAALWEEVKDRLDQSALRLSGGQQQRLCIARAIAVSPEILLLDEPCSALDPISTAQIEKLLLSLKEKFTIVIVTHNLNQARRIADQIGFFHNGQLIEFGSTEKIFTNASKKLTRQYVGGYFG